MQDENKYEHKDIKKSHVDKNLQNQIKMNDTKMIITN